MVPSFTSPKVKLSAQSAVELVFGEVTAQCARAATRTTTTSKPRWSVVFVEGEEIRFDSIFTPRLNSHFRWIHAKCEGLDGEEYQVLSLLPDSVEYVCK